MQTATKKLCAQITHSRWRYAATFEKTLPDYADGDDALIFISAGRRHEAAITIYDCRH